MGVRTSVTSTISIPVYGAWVCSRCGETNISYGEISCSSETEAGGFTYSSRVEKATEANMRELESTWKDISMRIITNPVEHCGETCQHLKMDYSVCKKCGNKEIWAKPRLYMAIIAPIMLLLIPIILVSLLCVICVPTALWSWMSFLISAVILFAVLGCGFYFEKRNISMWKNTLSKNMITLGSQNSELVDFASDNNYKLLSPEEVISIVESKKNN